MLAAGFQKRFGYGERVPIDTSACGLTLLLKEKKSDPKVTV